MTSRRQFLNAMLNAGWRRATPNWWSFSHLHLHDNIRDEVAWQYFTLFRIVPTPVL